MIINLFFICALCLLGFVIYMHFKSRKRIESFINNVDAPKLLLSDIEVEMKILSGISASWSSARFDVLVTPKNLFLFPKKWQSARVWQITNAETQVKAEPANRFFKAEVLKPTTNAIKIEAKEISGFRIHKMKMVIDLGQSDQNITAKIGEILGYS